jgi:hypothetical protein
MAKRAMPKWRPAPPALIAQFARTTADLPKIESRKMFGYPAVFLNGNMVAGLFQDQMIVRLSESDREQLTVIPGAAPFEPDAGTPHARVHGSARVSCGRACEKPGMAAARV